jgi:hypothetical protein
MVRMLMTVSLRLVVPHFLGDSGEVADVSLCGSGWSRFNFEPDYIRSGKRIFIVRL